MTSALLSRVGGGEGFSGETLASMPLSSEEVGARIARAREEMTPKPWSQFDLAIAAGLSPSTIYRWEKGQLPSGMSELIRLAEVLNKPFDYLTEPPERQAEIADLRLGLERLEGKIAVALIGIGDILDLLREAPGESGSAAPRESHP